MYIDNICFFSHFLMANFFHLKFCQSRKNGFWWKWRWRKTGMIIKKDHQPAVLMFVLFSTKRQCACYQISHSAPISRATISSSRLVRAISNWVGYQSHVQHVLEISCTVVWMVYRIYRQMLCFFCTRIWL